MRALLLAACCLSLTCSLSARADTITDYLGSWRIDSLVGVQEVTGPGDGKAALGKTMEISRTGSVSPAGVCNTPAPTYSVTSTRDQLDDWGIPPNWLHLGKYHLPERAGVINTGCPSAIVLTDDELLVNLGGFYYLASRVR